MPSLQACCFLVEGRLARWAGIEQWTCDKPPSQLIQGPLKRLCRHYELWKITGHGACAGVLFLVEGAGQGALGKNWGDGIATDPQGHLIQGAFRPQRLLHGPAAEALP